MNKRLTDIKQKRVFCRYKQVQSTHIKQSRFEDLPLICTAKVHINISMSIFEIGLTFLHDKYLSKNIGKSTSSCFKFQNS